MVTFKKESHLSNFASISRIETRQYDVITSECSDLLETSRGYLLGVSLLLARWRKSAPAAGLNSTFIDISDIFSGQACGACEGSLPSFLFIEFPATFHRDVAQVSQSPPGRRVAAAGMVQTQFLLRILGFSELSEVNLEPNTRAPLVSVY